MKLHMVMPKPLNPAVVEHERERRRSIENRIADRITMFSGSMRFVYIHIAWFGLWIGLGVENRADAKREVLSNQQWSTVQEEDAQNVELLRISNEILALTKAVHEATALRR